MSAPPDMPGRDLDPEIALFRRRAAEATRYFPALATLPPAEARRLVEQARAPWTAGGPTMRRTWELVLDTISPPLRVRFHQPERAGVETFVYLHGGGWTMFSLETHDRLMREYAAAAGMTVVGVDYALAPEAVFPVAIRQVAAVLQEFRAAPARFRLGPGAILLGGDSAGANLSLAAALALRDGGTPDLLGGLVLNYGVYDSVCGNGSFERYSDPAYMLTGDEMRFFWSRYVPVESERRLPLASPLGADLRDLPPTFLAIAECDVLADENVAMAERLQAQGVSTRAVVYPGTTHSFLEAVSIAAVSRRAIKEQARWMRELTRPGS